MIFFLVFKYFITKRNKLCQIIRLMVNMTSKLPIMAVGLIFHFKFPFKIKQHEKENQDSKQLTNFELGQENEIHSTSHPIIITIILSMNIAFYFNILFRYC